MVAIIVAIILSIVVVHLHGQTTLDTTIIDVDSNDVVTVSDDCGNMYSFYGTDYTVGEEIVVVLNNDGEIVATR